jgi:hypothetical protein
MTSPLLVRLMSSNVLGDRLGDHAAHRHTDEVRAGDAERVEQTDRVARHVTEVVLALVGAPAQNRQWLRCGEGSVRRPAYVAVVESDHPVTPVGQGNGEFLGPRVLLLAEARDQHHCRVCLVAELVVAQLDATPDVDDRLGRHADTRSSSSITTSGTRGGRR